MVIQECYHGEILAKLSSLPMGGHLTEDKMSELIIKTSIIGKYWTSCSTSQRMVISLRAHHHVIYHWDILDKLSSFHMYECPTKSVSSLISWGNTGQVVQPHCVWSSNWECIMKPSIMVRYCTRCLASPYKVVWLTVCHQAFYYGEILDKLYSVPMYGHPPVSVIKFAITVRWWTSCSASLCMAVWLRAHHQTFYHAEILDKLSDSPMYGHLTERVTSSSLSWQDTG